MAKEELPGEERAHYRRMLAACERNEIEFRYVSNDVWCASSENVLCVKERLKKEFVTPLKANRKVATCLLRSMLSSNSNA